MKEKMDLKKKKALVLSIVAVVTLIVMVVGASYAFFVAQTGAGANAGVGVTTGTTDSLTFDAGAAININATQANFGQNKGNLTGITTAKATLLANNTSNQATEHYNLFFVVSANDFVYSTGTKKAELVMKITDPAGKEVTEIPGLVKTTGGFDITTRTGAFAVASNYEITSTGTIAQEWKVEVSLVNLDTDQLANTGKTFTGKVFITKESYKTYELAKINNVTPTKTTDSLTVSLNTTAGTTPITKYFYGIEETTEPVAFVSNKVKRLSNTLASIDTVNFIESTAPSYKFTGLKDNTNYKIYTYAVDNEGIKSNVYETVLKTEVYVLPTVTNVTASNILLTSFTVTATATKGTNDIKTYYYSKDNGVSYVTSTNNTYTFDNLLEGTEYKIKVKVEDTNTKYSTEYYKAVTTQAYVLPVINSITESNVTANAITITVNATAGTNAIKTYYYSKDNGGSYVSSSSNSYTFSGLSELTTYNIKVKVEDIKGRFSQISGKSITTLSLPNLSQTLKNNYTSLGMNYHSGLANGANDGSYRFSGANPNNYVCFGPGATAAGTACPDNNLYRIIGVFGDQTKLIKKTSLGNRQWNSSNANPWAGSTINTYLNGEYLNSLTTTWSNKIASNTWQVGGMTYANGSAVPATAYNYEVGANVTFNGKIGLMYASDYGFAAQPQAWTLKLGGYNDNVTDYSNPIANANNWLFTGNVHGGFEWTMSRRSDEWYNSFSVNSSGCLTNNGVIDSYVTHAVFFLQSSVNLNGGNGTAVDPYRI